MISQGATQFHLERYRALAEWMTSILCVSLFGRQQNHLLARSVARDY
jgi:hypothetical protein